MADAQVAIVTVLRNDNDARVICPPELAAVPAFEGMYTDAHGDRYFCVNSRIFMVTAHGRRTLVAGEQTGHTGPFDGTADVARFNLPGGIAMDDTQNLVIADKWNCRIRVVDMHGSVSTLAGSTARGFLDGVGVNARFHSPYDIVRTWDGNFVVSDEGNNAIRIVSPQGFTSTLAGAVESGFADGRAGNARFDMPGGLAIDLDGSIIVADTLNNAIRRVTMQGDVTTIAGAGPESSGLKDGVGTEARFNMPCDVLVTRNGCILVADFNNFKVRMINGSVVSTLGHFEGSDPSYDGRGPCCLGLDDKGLIYIQVGGEMSPIIIDLVLNPPHYIEIDQ